MGRGQPQVDYSVRRILLLTVAGVASLLCSGLAGFGWLWNGAGRSHSVLQMLIWLCPAMSFFGFFIYFYLRRTGLVLCWLLSAGTFSSLFLLSVQQCAQANCTAVTLFTIAGQIMLRARVLWLQIGAAVCLLLDYSEWAVLQLRSGIGHPDDPPPST